jgi:hypothetical protein
MFGIRSLAGRNTDAGVSASLPLPPAPEHLRARNVFPYCYHKCICNLTIKCTAITKEVFGEIRSLLYRPHEIWLGKSPAMTDMRGDHCPRMPRPLIFPS